jgi:phosphohistidine phosphatase
MTSLGQGPGFPDTSPAIDSPLDRNQPAGGNTKFATKAAMRQLLLLRHAKSARGDPAISDHARPLTEGGRAAVASLRRAMLDLGLAPDVILVSSARRTIQTLEALEPWDENPLIEPMDKLYLATAPQILAILRGISDTVRSLLVIGHNPGLHDLALSLAGTHATPASGPVTRQLAEGFPTAALAEFTVAPRWCELSSGGGRLVRVLCPKDLPEMAN